MTKTQMGVVFSAAVLFMGLYWGLDTKPVLTGTAQEAGDASFLLVNKAKKQISSRESAELAALEDQLAHAPNDSVRAKGYEALSRFWFQKNKAGIAGFYAEQLASLVKTEEAWSIAGTTFLTCLQDETEEQTKEFCYKQAVQSLEKAISLNPSNLQHKINLALTYTENPPKEQPMKGILMLVDLNKQHPGNVAVLTQLGRLAIKTGQFDKAVERLQQALDVEPENPTATCLMAKAFEGLGQSEKAALFQTKCGQLSE